MAATPKRFDDITRALPGLIRERMRLGAEQTFHQTGDFILYWMHSTLRLHESPAVDLVCVLEEVLNKPAVILLTLAVDMPGTNERSLAFLYQGAREVQSEANALQLPFERICGTVADLEVILAKLCRKAVAVVTDDAAVKWQSGLASKLERQIHAPFLYVDSEGLLPRTDVAKTNFADFEDFLDHARKNFALSSEGFFNPWKQLRQVNTSRERPLHFIQGNVPENENEWLASLPVDHTLGPLWQHGGGSKKAKLLWENLRSQALRGGDSSRFAELIPYLRFGMVSMQRLAFDALLEGTNTALKFLEQTLLFREYARLFCISQPLYNSTHSLPLWARQSLEKMPYPAFPRQQALLTFAEAKTEDPCWDALQSRLRQEGSIPASGFDFWCKRLVAALPPTKRDIQNILKFYGLFALNADDPWIALQMLRALGIEQQPEAKPSSIYGLLTPPDSQGTLKTLGMRKVGGGSKSRASRSIIVIGAGVSGLACARQLAEDGYTVRVFEQENSPGGRAGTNRVNGVSFDIGAPLFTAKDQAFRFLTEAWQQMGLVETWNSKIYLRDKQAGLSLSKNPFVALPGMNALAQHLAQGLDITYQTRIHKVTAASGGWRISDTKGEDHGFHDVIVFAVPPMMIKSIEGMPEIGIDISHHIAFFPLWVALVAFPEKLAIEYDAAAFAREPVRYAFCESEKNGRTGPERWALHSSPEWALANSGLRPPQAAERLTQSFLGLFHLDARTIKPHLATAIFWPQAMVVQPLGKSHVWYPSRVALCGDWCLGRRIEDAYLSGVAAAARIRNELR